VPLSFWMHNFATENGVDSFVAESLRLAKEFGWDFHAARAALDPTARDLYRVSKDVPS